MIASGTRVRQYEVMSLLGAGGMGEVYLATDHALGRRVALKFLPDELARDEAALRRLVHEARAAARLDHPNICAIHEVDEDGARRFIVMPFVEGESLAQRLRRGPLEPDHVLEIARQVAGALAEAHAHGIVHRDIKPPNIMLTPRGVAKVLDFGIATQTAFAALANDDGETATQLTAPGAVVGTWAYMSPEQARGEELDGRSDIFSLGVVLFEALTGAHPFHAPSNAEIVVNILTRDPPAPRGLPAGAHALLPVLRRCLAKDRARRYPSAGDLLGDLEALRTGSPPGAPPVSAARPRRRALLPGLVIALGAVAALAALLWPRGAERSGDVPGDVPVAAVSPAYEDYVRGKVKLRSQNRAGLDAAIARLERAVAADPGFAPAQAELARAYIYKGFEFSHGAEQERLLEDAGVAIEKALAIDPNLAVAHLARGRLAWTHARGFPHAMAIRAYRRAIELDPALDEAHHELAIVYTHVGLLDEAMRELETTLSLNPDNTLARLRIGAVELFRGEYERAIVVLEGVPESANPAYRSRPLADALVRAGRWREAEQVVNTMLERHPADEGGSMTSVRALLLARAGRAAEAQAAIARALEIGRAAGHFHHTEYNAGCVYAMLGKHDLALRWLTAATRDGFPCYPFFARDRLLDPLRRDPRFQQLLARLKADRQRLAPG